MPTISTSIQYNTGDPSQQNEEGKGKKDEKVQRLERNKQNVYR